MNPNLYPQTGPTQSLPMKWKIYLFILSTSIFLLTGCSRTNNQQETRMAEQVFTSVVQTVNARLSLTPQATATDTQTSTPTVTETPTLTPSPTISPTRVTGLGNTNPGSQTNTCDLAAFISDVNIPDGTLFAPGTAFTKTWRLKNLGTCTWNSSYAIVFTGGTAMSGVSPQYLQTNSVAPGATVDVSINLVAPSQTGSATGYWQMQNASGTPFGDAFYVQINVSGGTGTPTLTSTHTTSAVTGTNTPTLTPTATATDTPSPTATNQ